MTPLAKYLERMWDAEEISHDDKSMFIRYDETEAVTATTVTAERNGYLYHVVADYGFNISIASFLLYSDKIDRSTVEDDFVTVVDAEYPAHSSFDRISIFPPRGERLMHLEDLQRISFWVIPSYETEHWHRMTFEDFDFQFWRKDGHAINFLDWKRSLP